MMANDGSNAIRNYNLAQFADPQSPTAAMKIGYVYFKHVHSPRPSRTSKKPSTLMKTMLPPTGN
jgi:hypothetical protein